MRRMASWQPGWFWLFPLSILLVFAASIAASPQQLRITGTVVRVDAPGGEKVLLQLQTSEGELEIPVPDTAVVRGADGDVLALPALDAGQEVELRATLSATGVIVHEVRLLYADFRETVRSGRISDLRESGGVLSFRIDRVEVYANEFATRIDGEDPGTGFKELRDDQQVRVRGLFIEGALAATSIHGLESRSQDARFELEGRLGVSETGGMEVAVGESARRIAITPGDRVSIGSDNTESMRLTGSMGPDGKLRVVEASSSGPKARNQLQLQLRLSPPLVRLKPGESAGLELSIKPVQTKPVDVRVHSTAVDIVGLDGKADMLVQLPVEGTVKLAVKAGTKSGQALITAAAASADLKATPAVTMVVVEAPPTAVKSALVFRPDHLSLKASDTKGADLQLVMSPPPAEGKKIEILIGVDPADKVVQAAPATIVFDSKTHTAKIHLTPQLEATAKAAAKASVSAKAGDLVARAEVEVVPGNSSGKKP